MSNKPFAAAAEQNRKDILPILLNTFRQAKQVLEIGSGTGQHAVYFCQHLTHLTWQTSDIKPMLEGIQAWIDEAELANLPEPIELEVNSTWPTCKYDAAYAANIAHIMHWSDLESLFNGLSSVLNQNAIFCLYGPFNIDGNFTSSSNQQFDIWLKQRDPESGIRDKQELDQLAKKYNMHPHQSWEMPANNKIISWIKT